MIDRRIDYLLEYLNTLNNLQSAFVCTREIDECIGAIRKELDLVDELKK